MNAKPIIKEITVNAGPDRVWKAITNYEDMLVWYFDLPGFRAEVGYEFQFYGETKDKKYLHLCKITEVVPHEKLRYSWVYDGFDGESFVTFEIIPDGDKTLLRLTHEGLETFPSDNPDFKKENFNGGWESIIRESFKHFVERN